MSRILVESLCDPSEARKKLAQELSRGSLALVMGAGSSKPLGLPSWAELLDRGFKLVGESRPEEADLELMATALAHRCKEEGFALVDVVSRCLYEAEEDDDDDSFVEKLMTSRRMGALGAMLMGSRRGSITKVVTFNYDSVLEEYLTLHGFVARVVKSYPQTTGSEDVTVFHPHGYVPSARGPGKASEEADLIFTKESIMGMLGDMEHPWVRFMRSLIKEKVLLFLGISESSALATALGPTLANANDELPADRRVSGFWIADKVEDRVRRMLLGWRVAPVELGDLEKIDGFLLSVCRAAGELMEAAGLTAEVR